MNPQAGDVDVIEDQDLPVPPDPSKMPMDISQLFERLSEPPEMLYCRPFTGNGVICPVYVPSKDAGQLQTKSIQVCETKIFLVESTSGLSEDRMTHFTPSLVRKGRLIELEALNALYVGHPMRGSEATELANSLGIRIIPCRWVLTEKTVNGIAGPCHARCVAQESASEGASAQALGISSTTPNVEAFRYFLSMINICNMHLAGLDISTAFLNGNLPQGTRAIVCLPVDCLLECTHYASVYLDLYKSMNGLRIAFKNWLQTCTRLLTEEVNLVIRMSKPTIMCGVTKSPNAPVTVMIYVDDLLVGSILTRDKQCQRCTSGNPQGQDHWDVDCQWSRRNDRFLRLSHHPASRNERRSVESATRVPQGALHERSLLL